MKCPKCQYLGFETGDRCKNCGYDFSLSQVGQNLAADTTLHVVPKDTGSASQAWDTFAAPTDGPGQTDVPLHETPGARQDPASPLPLFALTAEEQPLVRLPVTPRRPLAVRRTAEHPRPRGASRDVPLREDVPVSAVEPALDFPDDPVSLPGVSPPVPPASPASATPVGPGSPEFPRISSSPSRRFTAAGIDYALLGGIDTAIVYFTVRMSGLDMADWRLLPLIPLALFLVVIALAYVGLFTAIGGQTIGKMVTRIRVVPDEPVPVGAVHAVKRTAAVAVSWLTGGLGFLPALVGEHRALHDRLSGTRVIDLA